MKQIRLMLHRMQLQQRSQRLFTILLVLAQVLAVFIVLFGSAAIQSTLVKQKVLDEHQRNFTINFLFTLTRKPSRSLSAIRRWMGFSSRSMKNPQRWITVTLSL